jgi:hypothetical protein
VCGAEHFRKDCKYYPGTNAGANAETLARKRAGPSAILTAVNQAPTAADYDMMHRVQI